MLKKILAALAIIFILIQFIPTSLPEVRDNNPGDLLKNNEVPANIVTLLHNSCYDCHSNETVYPWYSYIAPVSFLVNRDTRKGRKHLNFSEWQSYSRDDKAEALDDLTEEVKEGEMPMKIYPIMHAKARLSDEDREALVSWAEDFADRLYE